MNGKKIASGVIALALLATPAMAANDEKQAVVSSQDLAKSQEKGKKERMKVYEEAFDALVKTQQALRAIEAGQKKKALELLAEATGKLEVLTSAHPDLALAPVNVEVLVRDYPGDADAIEEAASKVSDLIDDGRLQDARHQLDALASEIDVRVYHLPLATYPDAVKKVARLVAKDQMQEAARVLQAALATLVIVDHITPLPLLHAEEALAQAKEIVGKKKELTKDESKRVLALLQTARYEIERARAFGYIDRKAEKAMLKKVAMMERQVKPEKQGLLDAFRETMAKLIEDVVSSANSSDRR